MEKSNVFFTGDTSNLDIKTKDVDFNQFNVTVKLDSEDKFLGISEIKINKNFYDYRTRLKGFHEIDDFYQE